MQKFEENKLTDQQVAKLASIKQEDSEIYDLDVCFMLDCTGSMQPTINMARDKIKEIITELKSQYNDSKVRIAIVAYRDHGEKQRFEIFSFNESVDNAHNFLTSLKAFGGGDAPEDINGGFQKILDLHWKKLTTKMLYHLADAPCHGRTFHNVIDNYPNGHTSDIAWKVIMMGLQEKDINYLYYDIGGNTEKMFKEFKKIYDLYGKNKSHLIFTYEKMEKPVKIQLAVPISSGSPISSYRIRRNRAVVSSSKDLFKLEAKKEIQSDKILPESCGNEKQFVMSTVTNARAQQMRNICYQQAKLGSV